MNNWWKAAIGGMVATIVILLGYIFWWSGGGGTYTITDHLSGNVDLRNEREVPVELIDKFLGQIGASAEMRGQVRSTVASSGQVTEEERRETTERAASAVRVVEETIQNPLDCLEPCGKKKPRVYIEF